MFGRGGPLSTASTGAKLALAILAASVVAHLVPAVGALVFLMPGAVLTKLMLWQPFTYVLLTPLSALGLIFTLLIVWSMGAALEATWGTRRFLAFALGAPVIAGVLTTLLALVWPTVAGYPYSGAHVMTTAIWIAYGLSYGRAQISFWGIPVSGNVFALFGLGFVLLNAAAARSFIPVIPDMFVAAMTYGYLKFGSPRVLILKLQHWKYQRQLKSRSKHLNVITGERERRGSDRYIH